MRFKLVKIFASILILGACFGITNNVEASDKKFYPVKHCKSKTKHYKKTHHVKPCGTKIHKNHHQKKHCYRPCKDLSLKDSGAIIGASADFGIGINEDNNFYVQKISKDSLSLFEDLPLSDFPATAFSAKNDYAYGGNISYGYLTANNFETNLELGYHQVKNLDKLEIGSFIKSDIISLMLNGIYYANIHPSIQPYINLGIGGARTKANGVIITSDTFNNPDNTTIDILNFNNLKVFKLAYQAGLGLSTEFKSAILGIGYKFFGVADINQDDSFSDLTVSTTFVLPDATPPSITTHLLDTSNFKFGTLSNKIHNVSIFIKKIV